jgi:hypothetical protein
MLPDHNNFRPRRLMPEVRAMTVSITRRLQPKCYGLLRRRKSAEDGLYQGTTSVVPIRCLEIWALAPAFCNRFEPGAKVPIFSSAIGTTEAVVRWYKPQTRPRSISSLGKVCGYRKPARSAEQSFRRALSTGTWRNGIGNLEYQEARSAPNKFTEAVHNWSRECK